MGFSFRKSIRLGKSVRLNFSRSGLGISGGIKGARVSAGPRGVRLSAGAGPIRYQETLTSSSSASSTQHPRCAEAHTREPLLDVPPPELNGPKLIAVLLLCFIAGVAILNSIPKTPTKASVTNSVQERGLARAVHDRRSK